MVEKNMVRGAIRGEIYDYITAKLGYSLVELLPNAGSGGINRAREIVEHWYAEGEKHIQKAESAGNPKKRQRILLSVYLNMKKELEQNLRETYVREIEKFAHGDGKAAVRRLAAIVSLGGGTIQFYQHGEADSEEIIDTWNRLHPDDPLRYIPDFYEPF